MGDKGILVSVATRCMLEVKVRIQVGERDVSLLPHRPHRPPVQLVPGLFAGGKAVRMWYRPPATICRRVLGFVVRFIPPIYAFMACYNEKFT